MPNDFSALKQMKYSGRGISIGRTEQGDLFVGYTLTGRSPSSQARRLVYDSQSQVVRTELIKDDETLVRMFNITSPEQLAKLKGDIAKGNESLIVYPAISFIRTNQKVIANNRIVVSNGIQTELLYSIARADCGRSSEQVLQRAFAESSFRYDSKAKEWIDITGFEPDAPNNTSRINAMLDNFSGITNMAFSMARKGTTRTEKEVFNYTELPHGQAKMITTYAGGNESPLVPFTGTPRTLNLEGRSAQEIAEALYDAIGPNDTVGNARVSTAVMLMRLINQTPSGLEVAIINRSERGS